MRSPARICGLRTCYACRQPLGRNQWHVVAVAVGVRGLCCTWLRLEPQCDPQFCKAQRNRETNSLGLEFATDRAGGVEKLDL
ncbi:hypothetical protein GW17_00059358 [Ensete ventricosum]|nr:hypothetical protein GW17_00059358 [Ensete ventricosum]